MSLTFEITPSTPLVHPTPVHFPVPADRLPSGLAVLQAEDGSMIPAQLDGDALVAILPPQESTQPLRYQLQEESAATKGVALCENGDALELHLPEGMFSAYHFGQSTPRPYLWPVYGPGAKRVTRNFPMEEIDGEKADHPHHRSILTAFDEVNEVNNWAETPGHGYTRHEEFTGKESGPVFGEFTARSRWTSVDGDPILQEERRVRLYNTGPDWRLFDYGIVWSAKYGKVTFNDTKEAGVLSVRVATSMDGSGAGVITSASGQGEAQCWGQSSPWCDYSGPVEGETLGIAIFDHAESHNHPTRWHVRDYGLFATNPLSTACFNAGEPTPFVLNEGEEVSFRYRVLIHRGDAGEARVAQAYQTFAQPPQISVV